MHFVVLPGEDIGPEICAATLRVLDLLNTKLVLELSFTYDKIGLAALKAHGTTVPDGVVDACHAADGIILGPLSHSDYPPRAQGGINLSGESRVKRDLFVNVRPVCWYATRNVST